MIQSQPGQTVHLPAWQAPSPEFKTQYHQKQQQQQQQKNQKPPNQRHASQFTLFLFLPKYGLHLVTMIFLSNLLIPFTITNLLLLTYNINLKGALVAHICNSSFLGRMQFEAKIVFKTPSPK
jgi:hypothetical protein